jgi:hypothetical protein
VQVGTPHEPPLVKPIAGILAASTSLLAEAREALEGRHGSVELASEPVEWTVSRYYCREMGDEIWRQYVALADLIQPDALVDWKLATNELERRWCTERGRAVNLDPGYVGLDKLVLASTKDAAHRVYLGRGIYAEATLRFVSGGFVSWPYSYKDYASSPAVEFFNRVRELYRVQLASRPALPSG